MNTERRRHPRAPLSGRATVFTANRRATAELADVSESGVAVLSRQPHATGTFVRINFRVQGTDWVDFEGIVHNTSPAHEGGVRSGIGFVDPAPAQIALLRRLVAEHASQRHVIERHSTSLEHIVPPPRRPRPPRGRRPHRGQASVDPELAILYRRALESIDE